jgi:hypothetical protein
LLEKTINEKLKFFLGRMTRAEERQIEKVFMAAQDHSRYQSLYCAITRSMNITSLTSSGWTPTLRSKDFLSISQHGLRPI